MATKAVRIAPAAAALLLALALLVPAASAQSGMRDFTILVKAGDATLAQAPVSAPVLLLPNPLHDVLAAGEPALGHPAVRGVAHAEDAPDGLYVQAAGGQPVMLVGWSPGLGQRSIEPAEAVAAAFGDGSGLPVEVESCQCVLTKGLLLPVKIAPAPDLSASPGGHASSTAAPARIVHDQASGALPSETQALAPPAMRYQAPLAPAQARAAPEDPFALAPQGQDPSGAIAAAVAAGAALLALKLLLPLYHRFKRKTALDHPARQRIYALLRDAPGASAAELAEGSQLHVTTVKYHLDVLRRVGLVGEQVVDGTRRFYSYENGDRMEFLSRALLDEPAARAVYHQIAQHPGRPFIEVAKGLGMRKEHVHYHVQKLAKHGLITDRWEGGRRLLFPAQPSGTPSSPAAPPGVRV